MPDREGEEMKSAASGNGTSELGTERNSSEKRGGGFAQGSTMITKMAINRDKSGRYLGPDGGTTTGPIKTGKPGERKKPGEVSGNRLETRSEDMETV